MSIRGENRIINDNCLSFIGSKPEWSERSEATEAGRIANVNCFTFVGSEPKRWSKATREGWNNTVNSKNNSVFCNDHSGGCERGAPYGWSASLSRSLQNTLDGERE